MKRTNIGGQAILEGVMMRGKKMYAVAVRKPNKEIIVDKKNVKSTQDRASFLKLPIIRGAVALIDSLVIGMKTITYSAEFLDVEEAEPSKMDKYLEKKFGDKLNDILIGFSVFIAIIMAIGLFMVLPTWISSLFHAETWVLSILEGIVRILIFLIYLVLITKMNDIKRVFQYHGAEHKTINCFESEEELTVANVKKHSRYHKRCGTSFLLIVMVVSMLVFMFVRVKTIPLRILSRIILFPLIAGISYELIKWAGNSESILVKIISAPGMYLQKLTTAEPDDSMIEVAIAAMKGVLEDEPE